jgi:hypothetical protein
MVEVILINWKRPENVALIADAFRRQTVPVHLKLCDVAPPEFALSESTLRLFDEVFRWNRNYGCYNRFVIGLSVQSDLVWFHDDDMEPGPGFVEYLSSHAPEGGVWGQKGNRVAEEYYCDLPRADAPQVVDFVSRGYLLRSEDLFWVHRFMNKFNLWEYSHHDDIIMAKALQFYTDLPATLAAMAPPDTLMNARNLPEPHSCWRQPGHRPARTALLGRLRQIYADHGKKFDAVTPAY